MAEKSPAAAPKRRPRPEPEKIYHLVNPKGAIHVATREHARARLAQAGWRLATEAEVAELNACGGHQVADDPICRPWSPDPAAQLGEELA
jgi:hypothetical protein